MGSILEDIKKLLGLVKEYDAFDQDIIIHINTVLSNLTQIGVGPVNGFVVTGYDQTWANYFNGEASANQLQQIKTYIFMKVKLIFDPPQSTTVIESYKAISSELEYRLYTQKGGY